MDSFSQLLIRDQVDRQAHRIFEAHKSGDNALVTHILLWHPKWFATLLETVAPFATAGIKLIGEQAGIETT